MQRFTALALVFLVGACAKDDSPPPYTPIPLPTTCTVAQEGNQRCNGTLLQACQTGTWATTSNCADTSQVCRATGTTASCVTGGTCTCNVNQSACDPGCVCDPMCGGASGAYDFCVDSWASVCARAFGDCGTELSDVAQDYTSQTECAADHGCDPDMDDNYDYVAAEGTACMTALTAGTCATLAQGWPQSCVDAIVAKPITCTTISPGVTSGELVVGDPLYYNGYDNGHSDAFCVALTSGQSVTISTAAGTSGTPVEDTVLTLLDAAENVVAQNDDATGYYSEIITSISTSGTYKIIVSGYDDTELGTYQLTVAVN